MNPLQEIPSAVMVVRSVSLPCTSFTAAPCTSTHIRAEIKYEAENLDEAALVVPSPPSPSPFTSFTAAPPLKTNRAEIKYEAESPDEAALVVAAKALGFFFFKRTNTGITVSWERRRSGSIDPAQI